MALEFWKRLGRLWLLQVQHLCPGRLMMEWDRTAFFLLPYDVDQYYNKENSVSFFTSHTISRKNQSYFHCNVSARKQGLYQATNTSLCSLTSKLLHIILGADFIMQLTSPEEGFRRIWNIDEECSNVQLIIRDPFNNTKRLDTEEYHVGTYMYVVWSGILNCNHY